MEADPAPKKRGGRGTRPRGYRVEVWVTEDERLTLADRAASAGLSISAFMRAAGLNHPIRVTDLESVRELARLHGDLGRAAGLLKLWLATPEKRGRGAPPKEVEQLMEQMRATQTAVMEATGRL